MNPEDAIRDKILRYLYDVHNTDRGPRSVGLGFRDLAAALKKSGLKQQDVARNLDYLVQKKWAKEVVTERTFRTRQGTVQNSRQVSYKISDKGIDSLEAASIYEKSDTAQRINITNIHGVTVVGSGNVVNTSFTDLSQALSDLRQVVLSSQSLSDEQRLSATADIDSLQSQIQKPSPDHSVVKAIWSSLEKTLTVANLVDSAHKLAVLLSPLLH